MNGVKVRASAQVSGAKTNRVRVTNPTERSPQRGLARFRKDPLTRGLDCVSVCISLPVGELAEMDAAAESVRMARSHFIREAARLFAKQLKGSR